MPHGPGRNASQRRHRGWIEDILGQHAENNHRENLTTGETIAAFGQLAASANPRPGSPAAPVRRISGIVTESHGQRLHPFEVEQLVLGGHVPTDDEGDEPEDDGKDTDPDD